MRQKLVAGNWKMNHDIPATRQFIESLLKSVSSDTKADVLIAPSFTCLNTAHESLKGSAIRLGAQNLHPEESGAYTGEVSASMLVNAGCDTVIVGHSERRRHFGERDSVINRKVKFAIQSGLKVIFCIGETDAEREHGKTNHILSYQMKTGLKGLSEEDMQSVAIAYEPVWAIGTGENATPEEAEEAHQFIREEIKNTFGQETSERTRILYGGSVTENNSAELMAKGDIDGVLVGSASLDPSSFCAIIASVK